MQTTSKSKPRGKVAVVFGQPRLSFDRTKRQRKINKYRQLVAGLRQRVCA